MNPHFDECRNDCHNRLDCGSAICNTIYTPQLAQTNRPSKKHCTYLSTDSMHSSVLQVLEARPPVECSSYACLIDFQPRTSSCQNPGIVLDERWVCNVCLDYPSNSARCVHQLELYRVAKIPLRNNIFTSFSITMCKLIIITHIWLRFTMHNTTQNRLLSLTRIDNRLLQCDFRRIYTFNDMEWERKHFQYKTDALINLKFPPLSLTDH